SERSAFQEIAARLRSEMSPKASADTPAPPPPELPEPKAAREKPEAMPPASQGLHPANDAARRSGPVQGSGSGLFEQLPHPLVLRQPGGACLANAEFLRLTGYRSSEDFSNAGGLDTLFSD